MTQPKLYKNIEWLHEMYEVRELEVWQIAAEGGTSVKMIHEWLQRFGFYSMDEPQFVDPYPPKNNKPFCIVCYGESSFQCEDCC